MRFKSPNLSRSFLLAALSVASVAALLSVTAIVASAATSAGTLAAKLDADLDRADALRAKRDDLGVQILDAENAYGELLADCEKRLVALYMNSGGPTFTSLLGKGLTLDEASDRDTVIAALAESDSKLIRKLQRAHRKIRALKSKRAGVKRSLKALKKVIAADRKAVNKAREAAAKARAELEKLDRMAETPLSPRAVSPESVKLAVASDADVQSGDADDSSENKAPGFSQTGTASVYAASFAGKPTASGEPYSPGAMTAAHPSLPLGTWVQVAGPGGTALVRINDRGPFVGGRIIDLSAAAAGAVGVNGLGQVTLSVQS